MTPTRCGAFRNPADEVAAVYRQERARNPNPIPVTLPVTRSP